MGLFGNTVLQSENDSSTTAVNLLTRHLVNELYFSMDDVAAAAATPAWTGWTSASRRRSRPYIWRGRTDV